MPWIRFEDNFPEHPKVLALSDAAFRLHVRAIGYASRYLTDGLISMTVLGAISKGRPGLRCSEELVKVGLWERADDGFCVHDYLCYQPSKAEVEATRKQRASAGRIGGKAKGKHGA